MGVKPGCSDKFFRQKVEFGRDFLSKIRARKMLLTHILKRNANFVEYHTDGLLQKSRMTGRKLLTNMILATDRQGGQENLTRHP